ncbi:MAG: fluoride efflux transporter CrcB [Pyrinomonadaceae bacterium]
MNGLGRYLVVAAGGALGAVLRYYLGGSVLSRIPTPLPVATLVINLSGSFFIGFFLTLATEKIHLDPYLRLAIAVGFVGAFTTFSTFEYETARLVEDGLPLYGFLYVALSVIVGFAAVWGGIFAARGLTGHRPLDRAAYVQFESMADETDPYERAGAERDIRDSSIREEMSGARIKEPHDRDRT